MEQGEGAVVEMEVEAIRLEIGCMVASNPVMVYSTEVVGEHMAEMIDWWLGMVLRCKRSRRRCGP